jgi:glutaconate CoA-transferase subunit B
MAATMARHLRDGEVAITGAVSAIPMLACRLAQLTHAPNLAWIAGGSGAVNPRLAPLPASSCDDTLLDADTHLPLGEVIDLEGYPRIDVFFAGGLQIDGRGSCNLIGLGTPDAWTLRGPGSVGLPFLARAGRVVLYTTGHTTRVFVERVAYVSGPGHTDRVLPGGGPALVVTPLCVLTFQDRRPRLALLHPGVDVETVVENTGFPLDVPSEVPSTPMPSQDELTLMRRLDPDGVARRAVRA